MPRVCVVCGRTLLEEERSVCMLCLADMPFTHFERLPRNPMADVFNSRIEASSYQWATALFHYSIGSGYDRITQALKYRSDFVAGQRFAAMLGDRLASAPQFSDVDAVVPVPLHWTRRWRRGYNQAEIIARVLCPFLPSAEYCPHMLQRVRRTATQTAKGEEQRSVNVKGAFRIRRWPESDKMPSHILLVDDVFTTGSTLAACYEALHLALGDSVRISVATLAFAGE